jgi:hypothetical protein
MEIFGTGHPANFYNQCCQFFILLVEKTKIPNYLNVTRMHSPISKEIIGAFL